MVVYVNYVVRWLARHLTKGPFEVGKHRDWVVALKLCLSVGYHKQSKTGAIQAPVFLILSFME